MGVLVQTGVGRGTRYKLAGNQNWWTDFLTATENLQVPDDFLSDEERKHPDASNNQPT
jgi:hypothetical protein